MLFSTKKTTTPTIFETQTDHQFVKTIDYLSQLSSSLSLLFLFYSFDDKTKQFICRIFFFFTFFRPILFLLFVDEYLYYYKLYK